jgi:RimJ/RimL family protein N-acetyltransferase
MLAAIDVDRASFSPWLPWPPIDNRTLPECIYNIERFRRAAEAPTPVPDNFVIGIFDRATGDTLGGTGLHRVDHARHEAEIGYWMRADRRAQGLCTEAVAHLITSAFTPQPRAGWGLRRLHIRCAVANHASAAVPRKLGLRHEATLVQERWVDGLGWQDTLVFGVLAHEWDAERHRARPTAGR